MILDTVALSAFLSKDPSLIRALSSTRVLSLPSIVLGEYRFGLLSSARRVSLEETLEQLETASRILPVDELTARSYAVIRHELETAGTPVPMNDLWIAALARQHDLPVVTQDAHFAYVRGLKRIGW